MERFSIAISYLVNYIRITIPHIVPHDIGKIGRTNHTNKTNSWDAIDLLRKHEFPILYCKSRSLFLHITGFDWITL